MRFLLLLALILPFSLFAGTLTVTTNADAGAGSLREAITAANVNPNTPDTIIFNISDRSENGRTIILNSELPYIKANVTIDGTTQPGNTFGLSNARIKIQPGTGFPAFGVVLYMWDNTGAGENPNISVYGLYINDTFVPGQYQRIGIRAIYSTNLKIGGANKGNVISGFQTGIFLSTAVNKNAVIEHNWIGLNPSGTCMAVSETNGISISSNFNRNFIIQQNYLFSYHHTIEIWAQLFFSRTIAILDNNIGTDINGRTLLLSTVDLNKRAINIIGNSSFGTTPVAGEPYDISIERNVVVGKGKTGIAIDQTAEYRVTIHSNIIGTNRHLENPEIRYFENGILFSGTFTDNGSIQYPFFKITNNSIYYCVNGISRSTMSSLWISNNSFFCNQTGIATSNLMAGLGITITNVTSNSVGGTTEYPGGVIEIYSMTDCGTAGCQGFKRLATILSGSNNWSYCGYLAGRIVVTQFTGNGTTSNFSNCMLSPNKPLVTNGDCSGSPGSITGVVVPANASVTWKNMGGAAVGHSSELRNVAAGRYYYTIVSNNCSYSSDTFEIKTVGGPILDTAAVIVQDALCDGKGSIKNIRVISGTNIKWLDSTGNVVSTSADLLNVGAGRYRLSISDNNCTYQTQWFTIRSVPATFDEAKISITNATCGKNSGSISYNSTLGSTYSFSWKDDQNKIIANNTYSITNIAAGKYYFSVSRDSAGVVCSKEYGPYAVLSMDGPSVDINNVQLVHASCGKSNGSIKGLQVNGATGTGFYQWEDSVGKSVSRSPDLSNLAAGKYRLKFKDDSNCDTITTNFFTIRNEGTIVIDTTQKIINASGCDLINGSIQNIIVTGATTYLWVNTETNVTVATALPLEKVPEGYYMLQAGNSFGCEAFTNAFYVSKASFLPVQVTGYDYRNANCDLNNGYLQTFKFSNNSKYSFRWVDSSSGNNISSSLNINNLKAGNYFLYAKDINNCEQRIFSRFISQSGRPQIDASTLKIANDVCNQAEGGINGLVAKGGAGKPYTWQWFDSTGKRIGNNSTTSRLSSGTYYAVVTDSLNCQVTSPVYTIINNILSIASPIANHQLVFRGTAADIIVKNPLPVTYYLYDTITAISPATSTSGIFKTLPVYYDKTFYLKAARGTCSSNFVPVKISVFDETKIVAPNAFSPNNDGINDSWKLETQGVLKFGYVSVFNRQGQEVYRSRNNNFSWDGTYNGNALPSATYYYIIKGADTFGKEISLYGSVTILR